MPGFPEKYKIITLSLLLFLLNFVLKIIGVSYNDVAIDEPFSIFYAQMDIPSIFSMLTTENNPPLHFLLLHFWIKIFGISAFSVRFLSVLFSSLTVIIIFLTGKKFFSYFTGISASLVFTFSWFHMYFSHEARVYPLFVFFTALSLYYFLEICTRPQKKSSYIVLFFINLLLIYSHYFGFFVLAAQFISVFFIREVRKVITKLLLVFLLLFVSYIPNIIIFFNRLTLSVSQGTWLRKPELTELYGNLNRFLNSRIVMLVLIIIVITYLILLVRNKQLKQKISGFVKSDPTRIVFIWFAFPYLTMFIASYWAPMFLDRYIIYISVSFYLFVAIILDYFNNNKVVKTISAFAVLLAMLFYFSLTPDNNRRVKKVVETIKDLKHKNPNTIVFISPEYAFREFTYYYNNSYFRNYNNTVKLLNSEEIYPVRDLDEMQDENLTDKKVVYLDCGTDFAFGKNPVLDELKIKYKIDTTIHIYEIYDVYCFKSSN